MYAEKSKGLRFLYHTAPGRLILKIAASRGVSKLCGRFLDSPASKRLIPGFIAKNRIDMSEYEKQSYTCFNEFFYRQIKEGMRPVSQDPEDLISPSDGLLSAYRICKGTVIPVKQSRYTIFRLLGGDLISDIYKDGICLVFRLCVDNYHRYCYVDNAEKGENRFVPGVLHTVRPIALEARPVFVENCREFTVMDTENFGKVTQVEVGAMLVGKIKNHDGKGKVKKGAEKGRFEYGGSTIVLLLEKDCVKLPEKLFTNTVKGIETRVRMGQTIGKKIVK